MSFHATRKLLCDNKVALRHRLRLLSSCVTSSLYWCSGSWVLIPLTMFPLAHNPRQDAETNDRRAQVPHGNTGRTEDSVVQTAAQLPEKHKI